MVGSVPVIACREGSESLDVRGFVDLTSRDLEMTLIGIDGSVDHNT